MEGADRVGGQLRGDKECPFSGVTKSGSLEEGAGKRCSECAFVAVYSYFPLSAQSVGTTEVKEMAPSSKMFHTFKTDTKSIIIIMCIYHVLMNALRAHMIHINLNMIFHTHVKHSPTKTIYIKYYLLKKIEEK